MWTYHKTTRLSFGSVDALWKSLGKTCHLTCKHFALKAVGDWSQSLRDSAIGQTWTDYWEHQESSIFSFVVGSRNPTTKMELDMAHWEWKITRSQKIVLNWDQQGSRKSGRAVQNWRCTAHEEIQLTGLRKSELKETAKNIVCWKCIVKALCLSTRVTGIL